MNATLRPPPPLAPSRRPIARTSARSGAARPATLPVNPWNDVAYATPAGASRYDVACYLNEREVVIHLDRLSGDALQRALELALLIAEQTQPVSDANGELWNNSLDLYATAEVTQISEHSVIVITLLDAVHCARSERDAFSSTLRRIASMFDDAGLSTCRVLNVPAVRTARSDAAQRIVDSGVIEHVLPVVSDTVERRVRELNPALRRAGLAGRFNEHERASLTRSFAQQNANELRAGTLAGIRETQTFDVLSAEQQISDALLRGIINAHDAAALSTPARGWAYRHRGNTVLFVMDFDHDRALVADIDPSKVAGYRVVLLSDLRPAAFSAL